MIQPKQNKQNQPLPIDLTGPEGNVFVLMGYALKLAEQLSKNPLPILDRMTSSDYENAINVFEEEFGDYVILYR